MQRRSTAAKRSAAATQDASPAPDDHEACTPDVPASKSATAAARPPSRPAAAQAATPARISNGTRAAPLSAAEAEAAMRESPKFILIRSVILIVVFLVLWHLVQDYILEPTFQPHRTAAYQAQLEAQQRAQIMKQVCPDGHDCEFDLKPDFKLP